MSAGRRARGGVSFRIAPPAREPHPSAFLGLLLVLGSWVVVLAGIHLVARACT